MYTAPQHSSHTFWIVSRIPTKTLLIDFSRNLPYYEFRPNTFYNFSGNTGNYRARVKHAVWKYRSRKTPSIFFTRIRSQVTDAPFLSPIKPNITGWLAFLRSSEETIRLGRNYEFSLKLPIRRVVPESWFQIKRPLRLPFAYSQTRRIRRFSNECVRIGLRKFRRNDTDILWSIIFFKIRRRQIAVYPKKFLFWFWWAKVIIVVNVFFVDKWKNIYKNYLYFYNIVEYL